MYLCLSSIQWLVRASSSVPENGGRGLNLVAFERLVLGLACTNVLVVDRQLWGEMTKEPWYGLLTERFPC
jgi:hypothetical protein